MLKNLIKKGKSNKGFTLIELIVVIAIIAILALILVPRFAGFTESATERTNAGNRRTIETAVQVIIADGRLTGTGDFEVVSAGTPTAATTVQNIDSGLTYTPPTGGPATLQDALRALVGTNVQPAGTATGYLVTVATDGVTVEDMP